LSSAHFRATLAASARVRIQRRTATALVSEDAQLAVIDRKKYQFMLHELPSFAIFLIQTLANRVRNTARAL
jgi:CRP-like cAMP-binding protein